MTYQPQVDKSHYEGSAYRSSERWMSYWHQLVLVHACKPSSVPSAEILEHIKFADDPGHRFFLFKKKV